MFSRFVAVAAIVGSMAVGSPAYSQDFVFTESFNKLYPGEKVSMGRNAAFNTAPTVTWSDEAYTTVVDLSSSGVRATSGLSAATVVTNPLINATKDASRVGTCTNCALQFFFRAGTDAWSEQRFGIHASSAAGPGLTELWMQYDIFIPSNYYHRDVNPGGSNWFGGGEKLAAFYADNYSGSNPTLILGLNMFRKTSDPSYVNDGSSYQNGSFSVMRNGVRDWFQMEPVDTSKPVIKMGVDPGKWQRRTFHIVMPRSATSNDGVVELWVQTAGGAVRKILDVHNGWFYGGSQNYINGGYLLGWSNSGFNEDTYYLIDNVIMASSSRYLDSAAFGGSAPTTTAAPQPPGNVSITVQ